MAASLKAKAASKAKQWRSCNIEKKKACGWRHRRNEIVMKIINQ
jgi:hypothetical protein